LRFQQRPLFALSLCLLVVLLVPGRVARADIDFNYDGLPDLLFQSRSTGQVVYWGFNGAAYVGGASLQSPPSSDWQLRDSADFNGDGKSDLLFQNARTGQVILWYMVGPDFLSGGSLSQAPAAGYQVVGAGDFNADGHTELVFQNTTTGQVALWYLNGLTVTGGAQPTGALSRPDPNNQVVGVADLNGDGFPDLVFQNRVSRAISFVAMQGMQTVGGMTFPLVPAAGNNVVGLGDFNGDGSPDLLFQNATTGQLTYWLLDHTAFLGGGNLPAPFSLDWKVGGGRTFSPRRPQTYGINGNSYVPTTKSETLTATFTRSDGGITLGGYQGYVRVHVKGTGQSYAAAHNDAFYLYDGPFASQPQNGRNGGYSQLAFSATPLPTFDLGQAATGRLIGPVPAYNSAHDYTVLVNTGLSTPGQLHFGVSADSFSGNNGTYTITVTQLALAPITLKKIVFLGDSITQLGTYPTVVATALGATAINAGVAGQTTAEILARVETDVIEQRPDLCVLFAGTNDAYFSVPIAQFQSDYEKLLKRLKAANIPVVVVTPPHFSADSHLNNNNSNTALAPVVAAIRAEAALHNLTIADVYSAVIPLNADGEHPNAAGQAAIAVIVQSAIQSALSTGRY